MRGVRAVGFAVVLLSCCSLAAADPGFTQTFVSNGSVDLVGYSDETSVSILSGSPDDGALAKELTIGAGEKVTLSLPMGVYILESSAPVRLLAQASAGLAGRLAPAAVGDAGPATGPAGTEPAVYAAPWSGTRLHEIYNGRQARLKAVAVPGDAALTDVKWDFSDGTSVDWAPIADPYAVEVMHQFPDGVENQWWTGTVTVRDELGRTASVDCIVTVRPDNLDTKRNIAIDEGLWFLHKTLVRSSVNNVPVGYWVAGWGSYAVGATGLALEAFFNNGHLCNGPASNPYTETVNRAMNYLFSLMARQDLPYWTDDFSTDMNGNGYGLYCGDSSTMNYECPIAALALGGSRTPNLIAPNVGIAEVNGRRFGDIGQDVADFLASSQADSGGGWRQGGWRYYYQEQDSDMSVSQWPVLGLQALEGNLGCSVDARVKSRLRDNFLLTVQGGDGGFGYTDPGSWENVAKTGAGISCLSWVGVAPDDSRVTNAMAFIANNWWVSDSSYTNFGDLYAMYAVSKGARLTNPQIITYGTHDWYNEYSIWLTDNQRTDGSWYDQSWLSDTLGDRMCAAMGVLILTPSVFTQPPVALFTAAPNPTGVDVPVVFDASTSYDPLGGKIVLYKWNFGDGATAETPGPTTSHAYAALAVYTVTLTVVNDALPPQQGSASRQVMVTIPNHAPTAVHGGPDYSNGAYRAWAGPTFMPVISLDGSGSFDMDEPEGDKITKYEWELDNAFPFDFDEAIGPVVAFEPPGVGTFPVALRVTDDPTLPWPNAGMSNIAWTTVVVTLDELPPVTTLTLNPATPDGADGWYSSPPAANLKAVDDLSGVKEIRYWWDSQPVQIQSGDTVDLVPPPGEHTLHFFAMDNVGNVEQEQTAVIKVGRTGLIYVDDNAPNDPGPGNPRVSDPNENGSPDHPFDAIQEGINVARKGETVIVLDGLYTGDGNHDIDFRGRAITVRSMNGPRDCIIDCGGHPGMDPRGFYFHSYEKRDSLVSGFTIINAYTNGTGGAILCFYSSPTISGCWLTKNTALFGAGIGCTHADPLIQQNRIFDNVGIMAGGGIYCELSSPDIALNWITDNNSGGSGGGIGCDHSAPVITHNWITGNEARYGGGIHCWNVSLAKITNNLIASNTAAFGGGVGSFQSSPTFRSNTLADNTANQGGGLLCAGQSTTTMTNCLLWGDQATQGPEIAVVSSMYASSVWGVDYCDIAGGQAAAYVEPHCTLTWGTGNIDQDPMFVAAGDYHLLPGSPCIDAGDPNYVPGADEKDLDGNNRVINGRIDIGAYEAPGPVGPHSPLVGDLNGDGCVNVADMLVVRNAMGKSGDATDINGDGVCNVADMLIIRNHLGEGCE